MSYISYRIPDNYTPEIHGKIFPVAEQVPFELTKLTYGQYINKSPG